MVEEINRLREALVAFDVAAQSVQKYWGDPGGYTHNALLTPQLVHEDTIREARKALSVS